MIYEDTWTAQWEREISSKIHKKKLANIKNREFKPSVKSTHISIINRKNVVDRSLEISRNNRILYEKLVNISERKQENTAKRQINNQTPKVMNTKYKKLEADRIIKENMHLVDKLSLNHSELSFKRMKKEYEILSQYRERISRTKFQERIQKAVKNHVNNNLPQATLSTSKILSETAITSNKFKAKTILMKGNLDNLNQTSKETPQDIPQIQERTIE